MAQEVAAAIWREQEFRRSRLPDNGSARAAEVSLCEPQRFVEARLDTLTAFHFPEMTETNQFAPLFIE